MIKLKRTAVIILSAVVCLFSVACGGQTDGQTGGQTGASYDRLTPAEVYSMPLRGQGADVMPIGGYMGPSDIYKGNGYMLDSQIKDETFQKIADCGVNYIVDTKYNASTAAGQEILDLAEKYKISYFMGDSNVINMHGTAGNTLVADSESIAAALKPLTDKYDYFAGLYARDEPNSTLYPAIKTSWENFNAAKAQINQNELSLYYNLFPPVGGNQLSYDTDSGLTYAEYLQGFLDTDPDYMMFDSYPFMQGSDKASGGWLNLLGQINNAAKKNKVAWWGFVQGGGNYGDSIGGHKLVNEYEMNYNVNTMLAFGAKGIAYFPMCFPPEWQSVTPEENTNDNSLINKYGSKTPYWYYAQKINKQIAAADEVLMNSAHMGVIITGKSDVCLYTSNAYNDKLTEFRHLKSVGGDPSIVGCFDYKGGIALYVMNDSTTEHRGEVILNFDNNYEYDVIQRGVKNSLVAKSFTLTLEAGEGALVVVK